MEPEGRNTTSAVAIGALKALEIFKNTDIEPILLILSSDHQIQDIENFHLAIVDSIDLASKGNLVIFGVVPTYPATGFGYIKAENQLELEENSLNKVARFIEKPTKKMQSFFLRTKNTLGIAVCSFLKPLLFSMKSEVSHQRYLKTVSNRSK